VTQAWKVKGKKLRQDARKNEIEKVGKGNCKKGRKREIKRKYGQERSKERREEKCYRPQSVTCSGRVRGLFMLRTLRFSD
jgi:hypothetical protein